ncbi:hypothetical protein B1A54_11765 [Corynebacterium diphtheriae]|nr:hypothetical protein B1A54_11765 [Corynebacterium diphtheriae]
MMVVSHTVWCGAVVVVVFVIACLFFVLMFLCVGALLGVWDNMVVLVDHSCGFVLVWLVVCWLCFMGLCGWCVV